MGMVGGWVGLRMGCMIEQEQGVVMKHSVPYTYTLYSPASSRALTSSFRASTASAMRACMSSAVDIEGEPIAFGEAFGMAGTAGVWWMDDACHRKVIVSMIHGMVLRMG